jgi:hypothetical protein
VFDIYPDSLFHPEIISSMGDESPNLTLLEYRRYEQGYELNFSNIDSIQISLPDNFWDDLGICKTNVVKLNQ